MPQPSIPDTLGNLSAEHRIHGHCPTCDRDFDVPVEALIERLGPSCQTIEAMKRVVCSACGQRADTWRGFGGQPVTRHSEKPNA